MLKVYFSPNCSSCRKVKLFFKRHKIPFAAIDIFKDLNYGDLLYLLTKSDNGTDDIISTRSKIIKQSDIDLNKMKLSEIINFILKNPSVLKRPIIVDDHEMQIGYNQYEITSFLSSARKYAVEACGTCSIYKTCDNKIESKK